MAQNIRLTGFGIEIYNRDFIGITWDLAVSTANNLGEGWRLPTPEEMSIIRSLKGIKGIGNFPIYIESTNPYYWTSKEQEISIGGTHRSDGTLSYAYFFDIDDRGIGATKKEHSARVRFVRNI